MSVENIQLNLKQKINTKDIAIIGCSLLPDGRMVFSSGSYNTVRLISKDGVELSQIVKDKTAFCTYDTLYIKDNNTVAVSSLYGDYNCITIIDIESKRVMTTIPMDTEVYGMAGRGRTKYCCALNKGLQMLNLSDKSVTDIIQSNMAIVYYIWR
jgi:hypothetical protein